MILYLNTEFLEKSTKLFEKSFSKNDTAILNRFTALSKKSCSYLFISNRKKLPKSVCSLRVSIMKSKTNTYCSLPNAPKFKIFHDIVERSSQLQVCFTSLANTHIKQSKDHA